MSLRAGVTPERSDGALAQLHEVEVRRNPALRCPSPYGARNGLRPR